jgi:uncharacterized protein
MEKAIARSEVINTLAKHHADLEKLGVKSLRLFGSVARDEASPDSDIDFLVEFVSEPSFFELFQLRDLRENNIPIKSSRHNSDIPFG